jgi:hypothetical protein
MTSDLLPGVQYTGSGVGAGAKPPLRREGRLHSSGGPPPLLLPSERFMNHQEHIMASAFAAHIKRILIKSYATGKQLWAGIGS